MMLLVGSVQLPLSAQEASSQQIDVIGTWRLLRQDLSYADTGEIIEDQTSDQHLGILIYDTAGNMAVQIDRRVWNPSLPYVAYQGTYSVNAAEGVVFHHVLTGTVDSYVGTDQRREFELLDNGQTLIIRNRRPPEEPYGVETISQLTWQRTD
jgi:hypothetical protein